MSLTPKGPDSSGSRPGPVCMEKGFSARTAKKKKVDVLNANGKAKQVRKPREITTREKKKKKKKNQNNNNKKKKQETKNKNKKCIKKKRETDELLMFIVGKDSALFSGLRKLEVARPSDSNECSQGARYLSTDQLPPR